MRYSVKIWLILNRQKYALPSWRCTNLQAGRLHRLRLKSWHTGRVSSNWKHRNQLATFTSLPTDSIHHISCHTHVVLILLYLYFMFVFSNTTIKIIRLLAKYISDFWFKQLFVPLKNYWLLSQKPICERYLKSQIENWNGLHWFIDTFIDQIYSRL